MSTEFPTTTKQLLDILNEHLYTDVSRIIIQMLRDDMIDQYRNGATEPIVFCGKRFGNHTSPHGTWFFVNGDPYSRLTYTENKTGETKDEEMARLERERRMEFTKKYSKKPAVFRNGFAEAFLKKQTPSRRK